MRFLLDTNIFLEILLDQDKKENCEKFLSDNFKVSAVSDFSVYSIGILLTKRKMYKIYSTFYYDIIAPLTILSLSKSDLPVVSAACSGLRLDFDDAYQYCIAKKFDLKIITMDSDFLKIKENMIVFI